MAKRYGRTLTDKEKKQKRKSNMIQTCIVLDAILIYFFALVGNALLTTAEGNLITALGDVTNHFPGNFYKVFPTSLPMLMVALIIAILLDVYIYEDYAKTKDVVDNPNGDAAFEDDFQKYNDEFVIDPKIVKAECAKSKLKPKVKTFNLQDYGQEYKEIVKSPTIKPNLKDPIYAACWHNTQLYADKVELSLNGSWCQRNTNAIIFGASGSGKSRYFLNPNLLQANSNFVVTDPSGEIMLGYGAFLQKHENYMVKCLNISDMEHSCRFNPLQYIRDVSDIPIIVTTLMENTRQGNKNGGGDPFWDKATQALLCALIGYLFEVEPVERRNFYNLLELLNMAREEEESGEETDCDKLFEVLRKRNPNSYACSQYSVYKLAPSKTALSVLISTAVLISTFVTIPRFNNMTYKDEMELDKFGAAPLKLKDGCSVMPEDEERYEKRYTQERNPLPRGYIDIEDEDKYKDLIAKDAHGKYIEGEPYKMAVFLCIPTADTTYNWIVAMLYSVLFKLTYGRGEKRAKQQIMSSPKLAFPARFLIDECANIGKIPNLQEYLATCRKYQISIVPIFQSFSQIEKVYGKEDANSICSNCDTTLFLGGVDEKTVKSICDRLGKESIKSMSTGTSGGAKSKSNSTNIQNSGRELMSRIQIEQMNNAKCIVLVRAVKPFFVKKFNLNGHPNYKYTAEADPENYSFVNPFDCEYKEEEIEGVRLKKFGEVGYTEPKFVESIRSRTEKDNRINQLNKDIDGIVAVAGQFAKEYRSNPTDDRKADNYSQMIAHLNDLYQRACDDSVQDAINMLSKLCVDNSIVETRIPLAIGNRDWTSPKAEYKEVPASENIETIKNSSPSIQGFAPASNEFVIASQDDVDRAIGLLLDKAQPIKTILKERFKNLRLESLTTEDALKNNQEFIDNDEDEEEETWDDSEDESFEENEDYDKPLTESDETPISQTQNSEDDNDDVSFQDVNIEEELNSASNPIDSDLDNALNQAESDDYLEESQENQDEINIDIISGEDSSESPEVPLDDNEKLSEVQETASDGDDDFNDLFSM